MIARKDNYTITTDREKMDVEMIHHFLSYNSYWSKGIPLDVVQKVVDHSLNFGLFHFDKQIGYARTITDYATVAYLGDVFVLSEYRGQSLGKWLVEQVMSHSDLQTLRRWVLLTGDAHELYKKYGWKEIAHPERWMELHDPMIYNNKKT